MTRSQQAEGFICDICGEPAVQIDTWFNIASCDHHKHISPVQRQTMGITETMRLKDATQKPLHTLC